MAYYCSKRLFHSHLFPFVQAITYHDTPDIFLSNLRDQFEWYKKNFVNCGLSDLRDLLTKGVWRYDKPGLIISFDDGLRSNYDVVLPLLDEYGFTGWFMIPPGFIDTEPCSQIEFANHHRIDFYPRVDKSRIALTWNELKNLERRGHVLTCHSMNHTRLGEELTKSNLEIEIKNSKYLLESRLGHTFDMFAWVGGEEWAYGRRAYDLILKAGYSLVFCTNCAPITARQSPFFLERYHIEPDYGRDQLRLVLGGFYDLKYLWKRRRVIRKLDVPPHLSSTPI